MLPVVTTAAVTGFLGAFFGIGGTAQTAGFGLVGLVGPIGAFKGAEGLLAAMTPMLKIGVIGLVFIVVPFVMAYVCDMVYRKSLKIYSNEIFANKGGM